MYMAKYHFFNFNFRHIEITTLHLNSRLRFLIKDIIKKSIKHGDREIIVNLQSRADVMQLGDWRR